jgi:hypothetical protein
VQFVRVLTVATVHVGLWLFQVHESPRGLGLALRQGTDGVYKGRTPAHLWALAGDSCLCYV